MRLLAAEAPNINVTFVLNHEGTKVTKNDSSEGILKDTQRGPAATELPSFIKVGTDAVIRARSRPAAQTVAVDRRL